MAVHYKCKTKVWKKIDPCNFRMISRRPGVASVSYNKKGRPFGDGLLLGFTYI